MPLNLTAHEPSSPLPCLCRACLPSAPETASAAGHAFRRISVSFERRTLHAWFPEELSDELDDVKADMEQRLARRFTTRRRPLPLQLVPSPPKPAAKPTGTGLWQRLRGLFGR